MRASDAMNTSAIPIESLADETRYVLTKIPHDAVFYGENVRVRPDGSVVLNVKLPPAVQDADKVAMVPQVRIGTEWSKLDGLLVDAVRNGTAQLTLTLPAKAAGQTIGIQIEGFAAVHERSSAYRTAAVEIPNHAYLGFAIGVMQPLPSRATAVFEVETCVAEQCDVLFAETLDPSTEAGQGWKDRVVRLDGLGGQKRSFLFKTRIVEDDQRAFTFPSWANPTVYAPQRRPAAKSNIILLSIDTLSAKHLSIYGYDKDTAPFITETFAKGGTVFDHCVAAAATTPPAHMSMFTSVQPGVHGVTTGYGQSLPAWLVTLAEVLRANGYVTGAVTEDGWLGTQFGFGRGFNTYRENKSPDIMSPKGSVDVTFRGAAKWLALHRDQPFFLFVHTFEVHDPYTPPAEYSTLFTEYDGEPVTDTSPRAQRDRANYDREIRYTDDQLRLLFQSLSDNGVADRTIFVLVADHGEEFFEHGYWGHGAHLYEEVTHVPLMFWGPGRIAAGRRISQSVGHIDVLPTILSLVGAPIPEQASGMSLVPLLRGKDASNAMRERPVFCEAWADWTTLPDYTTAPFERPAYLAQIGSHKLSRYRRNGGFEYEYYDLQHDPKEQRNLYSEKAGELRAVREQLDGYEPANKATAMALRVNGGGPTSSAREVHLDPGQEEKLRALGYLK